VPPLYARPRHAARRDHSKVRAALVPAVLLASTGSALGGLAVSASAAPGQAITAAASAPLLAADVLLAEREAVVEQLSARASRDRVMAETARVAAAAAAEAARVEAERVAAEAAAAAAAEAARVAAAQKAAAPKYARPAVGRLTSSFGNRWGRLHAGIDLAGGTGNPIRAAAAGTVVSARNEGGYGKAIRIEHADGTETLYAHMSALIAGAGQKVSAGEQIGREGNTGNSTGPHLHFEVRVGGRPLNPAKWLSDRGVF
jgi:murein DD-endopeptidase MepM/ murein hydrolase activator NlpD